MIDIDDKISKLNKNEDKNEDKNEEDIDEQT